MDNKSFRVLEFDKIIENLKKKSYSSLVINIIEKLENSYYF